MTSKLLLFATLPEAQASLEALEAKALNDHLFQAGNSYLLITGMGSLQSCIQVTHYKHLADEIWSFGIAGSLRNLPLFSLIEVGSVSKWIPYPEGTSLRDRAFGQTLFPTLKLQHPGYHLATSDFPLHQSGLNLEADLIDMEGYGLALACPHIRMWKCVSDFAQEGGPEKIQASLHECSAIIARFIRLTARKPSPSGLGGIAAP